jgi:hypothetical protein
VGGSHLCFAGIDINFRTAACKFAERPVTVHSLLLSSVNKYPDFHIKTADGETVSRL